VARSSWAGPSRQVLERDLGLEVKGVGHAPKARAEYQTDFRPDRGAIPNGCFQECQADGLVRRRDLATEDESPGRVPALAGRSAHSAAAHERAAARFPGPNVSGSRSPSRAT
jgi:hypothetical protein